MQPGRFCYNIGKCAKHVVSLPCTDLTTSKLSSDFGEIYTEILNVVSCKCSVKNEGIQNDV